MKYFVIISDKSGLSLEDFYKNNKHLSHINITPIKVSDNPYDIIKQNLLNNHEITEDNQYSDERLAYAEAHIALWKLAQTEQTDITVFESYTITHKDFFYHQNNILQTKTDYDLIVLGYNLNWNMCLQAAPGLPLLICTFPGNDREKIFVPNNLLIDIHAYYYNPLSPQIFKAFSFAGMGCYSLSAKGANALIEKSLPIGNQPAPSFLDKLHGTNFYVTNKMIERQNFSLDIEINRHTQELNTYLPVPPLAIFPGL